MAKFDIPKSWDPGYAMPAYITNEGLRMGARVTRWAPRGTYDNPDALDPSWDKSYAVPGYVLAEGYGQGANVTHWAPRGFYVGATQTAARIKTAQRALGEVTTTPCSRAGRNAAAKIMVVVGQLPDKAQKQQLCAMMDRIHPSLRGKVAALTKDYMRRGARGRAALELALARALSNTTQSVALGDTAPTGALNFTSTAQVQKVNPVQFNAPPAGACSSDGKFIWRVSAAGTGYWDRPKPGEQCTSISTAPGPTVRAGGGGVSVSPTTVMKVGPFTIPVVRSGNEYTWGLDDYAKLTPEQAAMIKGQIVKKIDYPGRGNWIDLSKKADWFSAEPAPGSTSVKHYQNGVDVAWTSQWPPVAPWGGPWLTSVGWLKQLGFTGPAGGYDDRYMGWESKYTPIATFDHPDSGKKYGMWVRIQPVGPTIPATATQWSTTTGHPDVESTVSYSLQFKVAPMPSQGVLGAFWDWIMKYVLKLVVGFYDAVQDVAKGLSEALCAVANTPGGIEAAAQSGGPYAAAGAAANKFLLAGRCGVPNPGPDGTSSDNGWLIPVAIAGGAVLAVAALWPKKKRTP